MADKNVANEVSVKTVVDFDKNDVATVAIAKGESYLRGKVRESRERLELLDKEVSKKRALVLSIGEEGIPKQMKSKVTKLNDGIKAAGMTKAIEASVHYQCNKHTHDNLYSLKILDKSRNGVYLAIMSETTPFTKKQESLEEEVVYFLVMKEKSY